MASSLTVHGLGSGRDVPPPEPRTGGSGGCLAASGCVERLKPHLQPRSGRCRTDPAKPLLHAQAERPDAAPDFGGMERCNGRLRRCMAGRPGLDTSRRGPVIQSGFGMLQALTGSCSERLLHY